MKSALLIVKRRESSDFNCMFAGQRFWNNWYNALFMIMTGLRMGFFGKTCFTFSVHNEAVSIRNKSTIEE